MVIQQYGMIVDAMVLRQDAGPDQLEGLPNGPDLFAVTVGAATSPPVEFKTRLI